jgi:putative transcriptional regulator
MTRAGERIIEAAREALAIARGEADPSTYRVHVPETVDVRAIRSKLGLSQDQFATRFGISLSTLRKWEQGERQPEGAARAYLKVIDRIPDAVQAALRTT